MSDILFEYKCKYFKQRPGTKGAKGIDSIIYLYNDKIIILPKKHTKTMIFPINEISNAREEKKGGFVGGATFINIINLKNGQTFYIHFIEPWGEGFNKTMHKKFINLLTIQVQEQKRYEKERIANLKNFSENVLEYISPYDEIGFAKLAEHFNLEKSYIENEIKKMLNNGSIKARLLSDRIILREPTPKFEQTVYITIPPRTKLTALKCPSCQAPLDYMPPCKCEHCGVMIELMK
ncbi:MAG: PCI domain-containing protein [Candidatus Hodarchaeota archaeon]